MLEPKSALDSSTQWFEVLNAAKEDVQLKGYAFRYCSIGADLVEACQHYIHQSLELIHARCLETLTTLSQTEDWPQSTCRLK
jgi:hypothetical protein